MKKIRRLLSVLLAVVLVCTVAMGTGVPVRAESDVITVRSFEQLKQAISSASSGSTLNIKIQGNLEISDSVSIDKPLTINFIDGGTLRRASGIGNIGSAFIVSKNNTTLNFNGAIFDGFRTDKGGAIFVVGTNAVIRGAKFLECSANSGGGAVYSEGSHLTIEDCTFSGCRIDRGGGGAIYGDGEYLTIKDCTFSNCLAAYGGDGGAIYVKKSHATVKDSAFENCRAENGYGGAISFQVQYTDFRVENCTFKNCTARVAGAWVDGTSSGVRILHCTRPYTTAHYYLCNYDDDADPTCKPEYLKEIDDKPATCTQEGLPPYYECSCGLLHNDSVPDTDTYFASRSEIEVWRNHHKLPATGHNLSYENTIVGNTNTLQVSCMNNSSHKVSLQLTTKDTIYSGKAVEAVISGNTNQEDWSRLGISYSDITYYKEFSPGSVEVLTNYDNSGASDEGAAPVNAGDYTAVIKITEADDAEDVQNLFYKRFSIKQKSITSEFVTLEAATITHAGVEVTNNVTVMDGKTTLIEGKDYTVTGNKATDIGEYTVTVTGQGNYTGTAIEKWSIIHEDINPDLLMVEPPTAGVITYGQVLGESTLTDGKVTYDSVEVPGTFYWEDGSVIPEVSDSGETPYTVEFTPSNPNDLLKFGILETHLTVTVHPKTLLESDVVITTPDTYTGNVLNDFITVQLDDGTELWKGTDYTITCHPENVIDAGDYTATITFQGNYSGTVQKEFTVTMPPEATYSISAETDTLDFGSVPMGYMPPAEQTVTIVNTGNQPITLTQPSANHYVIGTLSQVHLAPGEIATFTVCPKSGLDVGIYDETMIVKGANGDNSTNEIPISAMFIVQSDSDEDSAYMISLGIDFGSIQMGGPTPAAQTVTIRNTYHQSITLTQPSANNYTIGELSAFNLAPGETSTFTLCPKSGLDVGTYNETIIVKGANGDNSTNEIPISATFTVQSGGGDVDPDPEPTPAPEPSPNSSNTPGYAISPKTGESNITGWLMLVIPVACMGVLLMTRKRRDA